MTETIVISLATSFVASVVFWFFFNWMPDKRRYAKVRPVVEYNIYDILISVLFYIELGLKTHIHTSFYPQENIRAGIITKEDFSFWLTNKCLNKSFQFDEIGKHLIPIGDELESQSKEISQKIENCMSYMEFLSAQEILLLRKISERVRCYHYTDSADEKVGNITYRPIVPHLSYMSENFYELNQLYVELQSCVWKYKRLDPSINKYITGDLRPERARASFVRQHYKKCLYQLMWSKKKEYSSEVLRFECYFHMGNMKMACKILKRILEDPKNRSVGITLFTEEMISKEEILEIFSSYYTDVEIAEQIEYIIDVRQAMDLAKKEINQIDAFYKEKLDEENVRAEYRNACKREQYRKILEGINRPADESNEVETSNC